MSTTRPQKPNAYRTMFRAVVLYLLLPVVLLLTAVLTWLRWESSQPREDWFDARQGRIEDIRNEHVALDGEQLSEAVRLVADTGLAADFRVIRPANPEAELPALLILGGHRTGRDAVELFGDAGNRAIVGLDYSYDGPESAKDLAAAVRAIPAARRAILDTVPAVSLVLDWLTAQPWVDRERIIVVGVSLGVPFAAAAVARDERASSAILVHGAADNRLWLEAQLARRIETRALHYPLSTVLNWLAYGPVFDTRNYVARIAPRPLLIVAAREDERTPRGQSELLFDAAGEPRRLRYSEGPHVQPNRAEIVAELLQIADEELPFLLQ